MKRLVLNAMFLCMAAVIFLTGPGATVFNFCCDECAEKIFTSSALCERHDNQKEKTSHDCWQTANDCCERDEADNEECCHVERRSATLDAFHTKVQVSVPFVWVESAFLSFASTEHIESDDRGYLRPVDYPPKITETKNYLSIIQVYLI